MRSEKSQQSPFSKILPLYVAIFIGFIGYSLMITVFTPLLINNESGILPLSYSLHQRILLLGVLLSLYPLGQFFGSSIIGALSDRYGRRLLLLCTKFIAVLFYALLSVAFMLKNFPLLMITSACAGLLEANITLAQSSIADLTTEKNRNKYFGYVYLSSGLAYIVGPLFGGKLASRFNDATPFWFVTALLFIAYLWIFLVFKDNRQIIVSKKVHVFQTFTNLSRIFTSKHLRKVYFVNFVLYLGMFGFLRTYPIYIVKAFGLGVGEESEFIAWVGIPMVLINMTLTGFLAKHFSPRHLTLTTAVLAGVFIISIIGFHQLNALWITLFLTACAIALCLPSCAAMLSLAENADNQGSALGNNQSLQVGAEGVTSFLGGLFASIFLELPFIIFGALTFLGAGLLLFYMKNREIK